MKINDFCINENETLIEAVKAIENNHKRNIFVVNNDDKITGMISQGDIIRSIISGTSLYAHCNKIKNSSFIYLTSRDMDKAYEISKSKNLTMIPVLDESFHLIDVITLNNIYDYLESKENT